MAGIETGNLISSFDDGTGIRIDGINDWRFEEFKMFDAVDMNEANCCLRRNVCLNGEENGFANQDIFFIDSCLDDHRVLGQGPVGE